MNHVSTGKIKSSEERAKTNTKNIADKLGISYQAYSAWEREIKEPSRAKVQ